MVKAVAAVILAAGMGTRMRSRLVKVLHPLAGRPMLWRVIEAVKAAGVSHVLVVVGHQADEVQRQIGDGVEYVLQKEQLGTGHAVMQTAELLKEHRGVVLVTYGDTPLYRPETYRRLIDDHMGSGADATLLSTFVDDPKGYGRVLRDARGQFAGVVEERDIDSDEVRAIKEINTGSYCFNAPLLFEMLSRVKNDNRQGEYYLPDVLGLLLEDKRRVGISVLPDATEALGINDRRQLADAEEVIRRRTLTRLMESGVTIVDPQSTWIHPEARIGRDTTIHPFTCIYGTSVIGEGCRIGPHAHLRDATLGDGVTVEAAVVVESVVGDGIKIEPFVKIGPGASIFQARRPSSSDEEGLSQAHGTM